MLLSNIAYVFLISLVVALVLTPSMRKISLQYQILDRPGKRRVHTKPVPTLGGIAIFIAFMAAVLFAFFINKDFREEFAPHILGLVFGGLAVLLLGVYHDLKDIHPLVKLAGQVLAAVLAFSLGLKIEFITNPLGGQIQLNLLASLLLTVFWMVALMNAVNLSDGLDGLAAGLTAISSLALFYIALFKSNTETIFLIVALMGCSIGFLRYNFFPAKIFMGDTGSMFLGFALAAISLLGSRKMATSMALIIPLTVLVIPIFDTLLAIIRRILKKHHIYRPDRQHLHHRLLNMGLSQRQVVLFLYVVCAYFGLIAFLFVLIPIEYAFMLLILLAMGVLLGIRTIGFIERKMRKMHRMEKKLSEEHK
ncbi:MAG: undecaprenyl/decaprenyl-phosphate alpha-N-acetylglucosaminyl 1-phosphate transferase [Candidatus Omnitrophica bacterium]|nr:undecaprenyl/decaprenyl-phosphate alpha-N-acetylglucosaminyl 1-phosphate transferase [Candidatus Omnitrophota bacterium]